MPERFLAVFSMTNPDLLPDHALYPYQQCVIMEHDGCEWKGVLNVPCCVRTPGSLGHDPTFTLTYREIEVRIACVPPAPGPITVPWYMCFDGVRVQFHHLTTCPLDGDASLNLDVGDCDTVSIECAVMEIPCTISCISTDFFCIAPSHVSGPAGGGGGLGLAPAGLDVTGGAGTFSLTGHDLTANVDVTLSGANPTAFELSTNGTSYFSSLSLTPSGGSIAQTVYVRKKTPAPAIHFECVVNFDSTGSTGTSALVTFH
jgi:hypothetical protein